MISWDHTMTAKDDIAAKNRFESFKLGRSLPSSLSMVNGPKHTHHRSHSRNASISSTSLSVSSVPSSKLASPHEISSFSFGAVSGATTSSAQAAKTLVLPSKRNSHHRRRSSVSTRHESAEMMGVSIPDLPTSSSEDNFNLGDKDSIRRRALWALEGKPDVSFNKVEIPELTTPDIEKIMFEFPTKLSFPAGSGSNYGNGLSSMLGGKRDSFKLLASSVSSKDQLHTLVEEEEEEDDDDEVFSEEPESLLSSPAHLVEEISTSTPLTPAPVVALTKPTPSKLRPATLNLRPLSLTPENLNTVSGQGLPTPSLTPSPRSGLQCLSLSRENSGDETSATVPTQARRKSLVISPTPFSRRPVLNISTEPCDNAFSNHIDVIMPVRRSSISYKSSSHSVVTSSAGLPTPEITPTFGRRYSIAESVRSSNSGDDEFFPTLPTQSRPLSTSEQHFLFKSHNALLARITDLEKALSVRRMSTGFSSSRPNSILSDFSSDSAGSEPGEPSDEMLSFIRDLKAERDELKKDVDGWRMRVSDLDKQLGVVARRVETERREAWVARSRVGLLEAEKGVLEKRLESLDTMVHALEAEKSALETRNQELNMETEEKKRRVEQLEVELENVKYELESERLSRKQEPDLLATPKTFDTQTKPIISRKRGFVFNSIDSESSSTDIELDSADDQLFNFGFPLKSVQEADEGAFSDEDDGLAGYEDEEESDAELQTSFSFESLDEFPQRSLDNLQKDIPIPAHSNVFVAAPIVSTSSHQSKHSLSKTWTFPKGAPAVPEAIKIKHEHSDSVDRFFGCLEDLEQEGSDGSAPGSPSFNYEKSKGLFASGFKYGSNDDIPFYLPGGVGVVVEELEPKIKADGWLPVVNEEEEEEETCSDEGLDDDGEMFGEIGGIRITFTPPDDVEEVKISEKQIQVSPVQQPSRAPMLPALNFDNEDDDEHGDGVIPFNFGRPAAVPAALPSKIVPNSPPKTVPTMITPPPSLPRLTSPRSPSPSSIPRAASRVHNMAPPKTTTEFARPLVESIAHVSNAFVTPPTRRGGTTPSFIPQAVSSPSPLRITSSKPKIVSGPTFIRPPARKPLLPSVNGKSQNTIVANEHTSMNNCSFRRSSQCDAAITMVQYSSPSEMKLKSIDLSTFGRHDHLQPGSTTPSRIPECSGHQRVPYNPSSSSSSTMASPLSGRLSFQNFTKFIAMPWSSRSVAPVTSAAALPTADAGGGEQCIQHIPSSTQSKVGFVSKERQLLKLKKRMEVEGILAMSSACCKRCDDALVVL